MISTRISLYEQVYLSRQINERQESIGLVFEAFEQPEAVCHRPVSGSGNAKNYRKKMKNESIEFASAALERRLMLLGSAWGL